ncbi:MAG: pilus assembly protein [Actinomycetota bacterium]
MSGPGGSRLRELLRRLPREEDGNAVIEFIGMSVLLLVPLVYLTLTFFTIQGAAFAAEGAARDAGRIISTGGDSSRQAAELAARLAFEDFDLGLDSPPALAVECEANPCSTPGARVHVTVSTRVTLPLINTGLAHTVGAVVPIEGRAVVVVDRFRMQG